MILRAESQFGPNYPACADPIVSLYRFLDEPCHLVLHLFLACLFLARLIRLLESSGSLRDQAVY